MTVLPTEGPAPRSDRPATMLLLDEPNVRVVGFRLLPGQEVAAHTSPSSVLVQVLEGSGTFSGVDGAARLGAGGTAHYAPGEVHSMVADAGEPLRFLAIITPRPA